MKSLRCLVLLTCVLALQACGGGGQASIGAAGLSDAALLGQAIFMDPALSASGQMSCASCHDPQRGHASPLQTPVAFGGAGLDAPGLRLSPSIRYLKFNAAFRFESDGTPAGGFFWDGRVNSLAEQARKPFLAANEMANADAADVIAKLARASYAERFRQVFGAGIFSNPEAAFDRVAYALERYQIEDPDFAPFSSKFDAVNAGQAAFTPQELRGLTWFNRADKGNCAACHPSTRPANAPAALFTDFSYDSLGVPRNTAIDANAYPEAGFYDMGLCGTTGRGPALRSDLRDRTDLCGKFKVPSLRNVALRQRFFHNGQFDQLADVVRFYVTRDTRPEDWYPLVSGVPDAYNDLPPDLRANVNVTEAPYNRTRGQAAALTDDEVADLVAFLKTLTDGYRP
jgi:cytochrome c peroxidase